MNVNSQALVDFFGDDDSDTVSFVKQRMEILNTKLASYATLEDTIRARETETEIEQLESSLFLSGY